MALTDIYPMLTAEEYTETVNGIGSSVIIPIVLGDLTQLSHDLDLPVLRLILAEATAVQSGDEIIYILAAHATELITSTSSETGNPYFTEYDFDNNTFGSEHSNFSHYNADLGSLGQVISYIEFGEETTIDTDLFGIYNGAVNANGTLITNPIEIIEYLHGLWSDTLDIPPMNNTAFSRAKQQADDQGYACAGIMRAEKSPAFWLTSILSNFLGSWWINQDGELVVSLDTNTAWYDIAGRLSEHNARSIMGYQSIRNLCNQVQLNYGASYTRIDRRYKNDSNLIYGRTDTGDDSKDTDSQTRYQTRSRVYDFDWIHEDATAQTIQELLVAIYKDPIWLIDWEEEGFDNIQVEKGDYVLYSWEHRKDENGLPLRNQIAQVLEKEIDFNNFRIFFKLRDTGFRWPKEPELCNGQLIAGDGTYLGGERDRRILA